MSDPAMTPRTARCNCPNRSGWHAPTCALRDVNVAYQQGRAEASAEPGALSEQGVSLADIDARLASGYAEFKQPLMVAVADVSALRGALRADPGALREALDEERLARALHDEYCGVLGCLGFQQESTKHHDKWYQSAARLRAALTEAPQEESGLMPDDRKFLLWCHERFAAIFHESPNLDWMQRLRALAASQESGSKP